MANIIVTNNSKFTPFTYADYIKPAQDISIEYQKIQEAYDAMNLETAAINDLIGPNDIAAQARYDKYNNDLMNATDLFNNSYLTPQARRQMLELKRRYAGEMLGIKSAYEKAAKAKDNYIKMHENDATTVANIDPNTIGIDMFLDNPLNSFKMYKGSDVEKDVYQLASNLARTTTDAGTWELILGKDYWAKMVQKGVSTENMLNTILSEARLGDANANQALANIVQGALRSRGITPEEFKKNPQAYEQLYQSAMNGMWSALGQSDEVTLANKRYADVQSGGENKDLITYSLRSVPKADASGASVKTQIEDIEQIIKDINEGKRSSKEKQSKQVGYSTTGGSQSVVVDVDVAQQQADKLNELLLSHGYKGDTVTVDHQNKDGNIIRIPKEARDYLDDIIAKSITIDYDHMINSISDNGIRNFLNQTFNLSTEGEEVTALVTNTKGDKINIDDIDKCNMYIDGKTGDIFIAGKDKDGKSIKGTLGKTYEQMVDVPFGKGSVTYEKAKEMYIDLIKEHSYAAAQKLLHAMGRALIAATRDFTPEQSTSSSNPNTLNPI